MMTLKIALRNVFRHKARSIVTLSTIAFGCAALIFIGGFFEDVFWRLRESYIRAQTGHIQIFKKGFNEHGSIDPFNYLIEKPDEIKDIVKHLAGVRSVSSRLYFSGLISTGENTISFLGQGLDPAVERYYYEKDEQNLIKYSQDPDAGQPVVISGDGLDEGDTGQIMMGKGLAEAMNAKAGSTITLLVNTVNGSTNAMDVKIKGIFHTSLKDYDDIFVRIPIKTAQKLLATSGVDRLVVRLNNTEDTGKVFKELNSQISRASMNLELKRWEDLVDFYNKTVALFNQFYFSMRLIIAIVVVLGIFNTMNMAVLERISEIGTIMALGVRQKGILKLFCLEGVCLGFVGGLLGITAGYAVVRLVSSVGIMMPPAPGGSVPWVSTPKFIPAIAIFSFVLSVVMGGLSALFPAYKASRLNITTALRYR